MKYISTLVKLGCAGLLAAATNLMMAPTAQAQTYSIEGVWYCQASFLQDGHTWLSVATTEYRGSDYSQVGDTYLVHNNGYGAPQYQFVGRVSSEGKYSYEGGVITPILTDWSPKSYDDIGNPIVPPTFSIQTTFHSPSQFTGYQPSFGNSMECQKVAE